MNSLLIVIMTLNVEVVDLSDRTSKDTSVVPLGSKSKVMTYMRSVFLSTKGLIIEINYLLLVLISTNSAISFNSLLLSLCSLSCFNRVTVKGFLEKDTKNTS